MSRMERVNQVFKREISRLILMGEITDPRVSSVTITYVDVSKDLSWAHVGFSVLNDGPSAVQAALNGLSSASGRIRCLLTDRVEVRYMPQLKFVYDNSVLENFRMSVKLEDIRSERESRLGPEVVQSGDEQDQKKDDL